MRPRGGPLADPRLLWLPPLIALLPALALAAYSLSGPWFTNRAATAVDAITWTGAALSFALGAALLRAPFRERAVALLDEVGGLPTRPRAVWLGLIYAGTWGFFFFIKYCQYRGFQLPGDTAGTVNVGYNVLHHLSFEHSMDGLNLFALHFQPLNALLAPFVVFGRGTAVLLALQCAVFCSMPFAVYALVFRRTRSSAAGAAGLWLCLSSPFMFHIAANNLDAVVNITAFFLWAMVFAERGRAGLAALFFFLTGISNEHAMVCFFGMGLYLILRSQSTPRSRGWGVAVCAASAALFAGEMLIVNSFPQTERLRSWAIVYGHLGATPAASFAAVFTDPLRLVKVVAWPPSRLATPASLLLATGFFCLLSPAAVLAWFVNYLPCFLATPGSPMARLTLHYAAQVVGPVWWAMAAGLSLAWLRLGPGKRSSLLLTWALLVGGVNLSLYRVPILLKEWLPHYFEQAPAVAAIVPPDASVWATEFLTPWLADRDRLKMLTENDDSNLERRRFLPDYIALEKVWIPCAEPLFRRKFAALLQQEHYERVLDSTNFLVFKHPRYPLPRGAAEAPFDLPKPIEGADFRLHLHEPGQPESLPKLADVD